MLYEHNSDTLRGFFNTQLHAKYAVLEKFVQLKRKTCAIKKVNGSKNGRLRYEIMGETQPEMELIEVTAFIYSSRQKQAVQSHL